MTRKSTWLIIPVGRDRFDITRNGRQIKADLTLTEVGRYLLRHSSSKDIFIRQEPDGYRVRLSESDLKRPKQ